MSSPVRRSLVLSAGLTLVLACTGVFAPAALAKKPPTHHIPAPRVAGINVDASTIPQLQALMNRHRLKSVQLTQFYLHRIKKLNPLLNAVITVSPTALADARAADKARKRGVASAAARDPGDRQGQRRHDRHADDRRLVGARRQHARATRSSSSGCAPPARSSSPRPTCRSGRTSGPRRRRAAGAASAARPTWPTSSTATRAARARDRASACLGRPRDRRASAPRPTARSSARRARTAIVGIKPTLGLLSRAGIVPISADQDTAGPMTRNVTDAAVDARAPMTGHRPERSGDRRPGRPRVHRLHASSSTRHALDGARIGVWREGTLRPDRQPRGRRDHEPDDRHAREPGRDRSSTRREIPIEPAYGRSSRRCCASSRATSPRYLADVHRRRLPEDARRT